MSPVGNPVKAKCGPDMYADEAESEAGSAASDSEFTVLDSDDSNASIFGLRSALHEREDFDELSDLSSEDDDQRSLAERDQVSRWRTEHFLLDDRDFAYVYETFEEAYCNAGRAVSMAWSMDRLLAEPEMISGLSKFRAIEATASKIRKVDKQKNDRGRANKKQKIKNAPFLRQPGQGADPEEKFEDKKRFVEPLAQLMMNCRVGHSENASASDEDFISSHRRTATRVVEASDIPTLHRAVTTAIEFFKYLGERASHMTLDNIDPTMIERFLWYTRAQVRAVNAFGWLCRNLYLGWPLQSI